MSEFNALPVTLAGRHVRLEPLTPRHASALFEAGSDPEIHRYLIGRPPSTLGDVEQTIAAALAQQAAGATVAFVVVALAGGRTAGTTRYLDIRRADRALEIGHTWLAPEFQRTAANTEAKYLLLRHAFEALGAVRVQLKTDERNERSRRAIERIGGRFEGILRNYQTRWDGFVRNTALFAITDGDWPEVKVRLEARLASGDGRGGKPGAGQSRR